MNTLDLKGLDGSSPLGFLAALGVLRVASLADPASRMGWRHPDGGIHPFIETALSLDSFPDAVCAEARRVARTVAAYGDIIKSPPATFQAAARAPLAEHILPGMPSDADFFSAFACEGIVEKDDTVKPSLLSFSNGGGMQFLLKDFRALAQRCSAAAVTANILQGEQLTEVCTGLNWDPASLRSYALRWDDPNSAAKLTDVPANVLAFLGLAACPSVPNGRGLATVGFGASREAWNWPIWDSPQPLTVVRALLAAPPSALAGVRQRFSSRRFIDNKRSYFAQAVAV